MDAESGVHDPKGIIISENHPAELHAVKAFFVVFVFYSPGWL